MQDGLTGHDPPARLILGLSFTQKPKPLLDRLNKSAAAGDFKGLLQTAHALKSSSANVGARNLAELCRELEEGARAEDIPEVEERVAGIEAEYKRVHVALMAELDE